MTRFALALTAVLLYLLLLSALLWPLLPPPPAAMAVRIEAVGVTGSERLVTK